MQRLGYIGGDQQRSGNEHQREHYEGDERRAFDGIGAGKDLLQRDFLNQGPLQGRHIAGQVQGSLAFTCQIGQLIRVEAEFLLETAGQLIRDLGIVLAAVDHLSPLPRTR